MKQVCIHILVCVHIHSCVCIHKLLYMCVRYTFLRACIHKYVSMRVSKDVYVLHVCIKTCVLCESVRCTHARVRAYLYVHMSRAMCVCVCVMYRYLYACMYVCVYGCKYVCT